MKWPLTSLRFADQPCLVGFIQSGVQKGLNGTLGHAGWYVFPLLRLCARDWVACRHCPSVYFLTSFFSRRRWLFIIDAVITFFVALFGVVMFPGTPEKPTAWYLTAEDKKRCVERLRQDGKGHETDIISVSLFKRVFASWQLWMLLPVWVRPFSHSALGVRR